MFEPDYRNIVDACSNVRPGRLPLYEHIISPGIMEQVLGVDLLCQEKPDVIYEKVMKDGMRFRERANGFALGSGNSIPEYVPVEGYLSMIKAGQKIRETENTV